MPGAQRLIVFDDDYILLSLTRLTGSVTTRTVLDIRIVQDMTAELVEREILAAELVEDQVVIGELVDDGGNVSGTMSETDDIQGTLTAAEEILGILES